MVSSAALDAASWLERTCDREGRLAIFSEERTTGLEFGRLAYITISQTEHGSSGSRLLIFLLFSLVLQMELLHAPSFLHVYGRIGRARDFIKVNFFGFFLLRLGCKGLIRNISNNFIFEFVLLVRVSLK